LRYDEQRLRQRTGNSHRRHAQEPKEAVRCIARPLSAC
jgi:hypothetical protein